MKKLIGIIFSFFSIVSTFAQIEIADCIIMIDKKVDLDISVNFYFQNDNLDIDTIKCSYYFCSLEVSQEVWDKLQTIHDSNTVVLNVIWTEQFCDFTTKKHYFSSQIDLNHLKRMKVINITTFNKKKTIYFFDIIGDGFNTMHLYEKKFGNRRAFFKKIEI